MSSHGRTSLQRLLRSTLAYALLPLVGLVTAPILARMLGPTGRGQLAAVLQPLTVIEAVIVAGIPTAVTYFIASGARFRDIRRYVLTVTGCTFILAAIAIGAYSRHIAEATGLSLPFIIIVWSTCIVTLLLAIRRAVIQGHGHLQIIDLERALIALLRLSCIVTLFWFGVTLVEPYILATLASSLIAATVICAYRIPANKGPKASKPKKRKLSMKAFYSYTLLASSGHVANILNIRIDQAMLPLVLHPYQLGLFSVAVTIAELPSILSTVVTRNLLTEASRGSPSSQLIKTACMGTALIAITSAILWLLCPWAVQTLFGEEFDMATEIAQILLIGTVFSSITASTGVILTGTGRPGKATLAPAAGIAAFTCGFVFMKGDLDVTTAAILVLACRFFSCLIGSVVLYLSWRSRPSVIAKP